jgi:hypothetical protein
MTLRALLAALVSLSLLACGVKSDLMQPGGVQPDKRQSDPSKPPQPLGQ